MKLFSDYLTEDKNKGWGITFIDIDETVFNTFAKIHVIKNGKLVKKLDNQEFNSYVLKGNEEYDFGEFRSAEIFKKTSIPIPKTINRIKKMLSRIRETGSKSRIVFLTARADFDDKKSFLKLFEDHGISMDKKNVYVERAGNIKTGTIPEKKKKIMLGYIKSGIYRRVRLVDDHKPNLKALLDIRDNISDDIKNKVKKKYNLNDDEIPIKFFALWCTDTGQLQEIQ